MYENNMKYEYIFGQWSREKFNKFGQFFLLYPIVSNPLDCIQSFIRFYFLSLILSEKKMNKNSLNF